MKLVKRQKGVNSIKLQAERTRRFSGGQTLSRRQSEQGYVPVPKTRAEAVKEAEAYASASITRYEEKRAREAAMTPDEAHENGTSYQGKVLDTKGKRDGNCNRTACQRSLAGMPRWSMHDHMTGGRLYYCQRCVDLFHESDRQFREPLRCSIVEGDH